jgi:hypothetical protein
MVRRLEKGILVMGMPLCFEVVNFSIARVIPFFTNYANFTSDVPYDLI